MRKEATACKSEIKRFNGGVFFAGANSAHGFVSFYDSILGDKKIEKVYILKGGPGTGKSSFMKRTAEYAERRGMSLERYKCSSDPDSLDGVVIDGKVAILDGTSPHTVDMSFPGVRDEIINLGAFWDDNALKKRSAEIEELISKKSDGYKKAYRYLSAYGDMPIIYAGGVMSNSIIKARLLSKYDAGFAAPQLSSDNAVGIATLAKHRFYQTEG